MKGELMSKLGVPTPSEINAITGNDVLVINWNEEQKLPCEDDSRDEDSVSCEMFTINFKYNGVKMSAYVDFILYLDTERYAGGCGVDGGDSEELCSVTVTDVSLCIKELYDNGGDELILGKKDFDNLQNLLEKDLNEKY
jgi:hypothetical protein